MKSAHPLVVMPMTKRRWYWVLALALAFGGGTAFAQESAKPPPPPPPGVAPPPPGAGAPAMAPGPAGAPAPHAAAAMAAPALSPVEHVDPELARYCANVEPSAAEARMEYQSRRLAELEARVKTEIDELKKREDAAREWVSKRDEMMKSASEDIVQIYSKMAADAAAGQMATMDDQLAASILSKLKPQAASAILAEMDADKAGRLTTLMSGANADEKKT